MVKEGRKLIPIVLLFLLPQLVRGLYVQPQVVIRDCEWAIFGSSPYVYLPYKSYVFMVIRETFTQFDVSVLDIRTGNVIMTMKLNGLYDDNQSPVQVLLCPKEKRLIIFGAWGDDNYVVLDISNPQRPLVIKSVGLK